MGFEPAVQMWSLDRYDAEKGPEGRGPRGTWKMGERAEGGALGKWATPQKRGRGGGGS